MNRPRSLVTVGFVFMILSFSGMAMGYDYGWIVPDEVVMAKNIGHDNPSGSSYYFPQNDVAAALKDIVRAGYKIKNVVPINGYFDVSHCAVRCDGNVASPFINALVVFVEKDNKPLPIHPSPLRPEELLKIKPDKF